MEILKIRDKETGKWISVPAIVGPPGHTPQRGVDYYTEADQQAIVNAVVASLPNGDEVSY